MKLLFKHQSPKGTSIFKSQKGVVIFLSLSVLTLFLGISLGLSTILLREITISGDIGNSLRIFYGLDTGVEHLFYIQRKCSEPGCLSLPNPPYNCESDCSGVIDGGGILDYLDNGVIYKVDGHEDAGSYCAKAASEVTGENRREVQVCY